MPTKLSAADYFEIIAKNHQALLKKNMVSHLDLPGFIKDTKLVETYVSFLDEFREKNNRYLDNAVAELSLANRMEHGGIAALIGLSVGASVFVGSDKSSILSKISIGPSAKTVAESAFATVLGVGVSTLLYKAWKEYAKNPAADDYEIFQKGMKEAGFANEKYMELSSKLVKLFHYRECLLLGLKDDTNKNMRLAFKEAYIPNATPDNEKAFSSAIEVYFLEKLNTLFNDAFKDIYAIHDDEIQTEKKQNVLTRWFKSFFEKAADRQKFTQQLQIHFMNTCVNFLVRELNQPAFFIDLVKHKYLISSIVGLIVGAVILSIAAVTGALSLTFVGISLLSTLLTAGSTYFAINNFGFLQYKRSASNRDAIRKTIDQVTKEAARLQLLVATVVATSPANIKQLNDYKKQVQKHFLNCLSLTKIKKIMQGAGHSWIREHASRYLDNKICEIDLSKELLAIISIAELQTETLVKILNTTSLKNDQKKELIAYLTDTSTYLKDEKNSDFIKSFDLINKIKQQLLEAISSLTLTQDSSQKILPPELVAFYTDPIEKGGLGGLKQDLEQVRTLAPIVDNSISLDSKHPYQHLLKVAQDFDCAIQENDEFILNGDSDYRELLGLQIEDPSLAIETKINTNNVQSYLTHSFDFLLSLNNQKQNTLENINLTADASNFSCINTDAYLLYRTLLIKQLSNLADPNNQRLSTSIKRDIEKITKERLNIDPRIAFDNALQQSLFIKKTKTPPVLISPLGRPLTLNNIGFIADAIRVDLAYNSSYLTKDMFINQEAEAFLITKTSINQTLFAYKNSDCVLIPRQTREYKNKIEQTISLTKEFIANLQTRQTYTKIESVLPYALRVQQEINNIITEIDKLVAYTSNDGKLPKYHLEAKELLIQYQQKELSHVLLPLQTTFLHTNNISLPNKPFPGINIKLPVKPTSNNQAPQKLPNYNHASSSVLFTQDLANSIPQFFTGMIHPSP